MANPLVRPEQMCVALTKAGAPCQAPRLPGESLCLSHHPARSIAAQAKRRIDASDPVIPDITLASLARLDLSDPASLDTARRGIWQNLLASQLEPHVAKVALDVAETVHRNATRKVTGESSVTRMTKAVMAQPPPPVDE